MVKPQVDSIRTDYPAIRKGRSVNVDKNRISKHDVNQRVFGKEPGHASQRANEVLFVTVQIGENAPARAGDATVNRIVHSRVSLLKKTQSRLIASPFVCFRTRSPILD